MVFLCILNVLGLGKYLHLRPVGESTFLYFLIKFLQLFSSLCDKSMPFMFIVGFDRSAWDCMGASFSVSEAPAPKAKLLIGSETA